MSVSFIPFERQELPEEEMMRNAKDFFAMMSRRRSVRDFSDKPVSKELIRDLIMTASTAPSGAHKQPWTFCAVSNPDIKKEIRKAAEKEEYLNYNGRMSDQWLQDLSVIGTDWKKPFLEIAPWLLVVFKKPYEVLDAVQYKNYYVNESVGLACGFLLAAIHRAGLVALTHTPSPMNFLERILERPGNERAFLLIPVGYPSTEAMVPDLVRKSENEIVVFFD